MVAEADAAEQGQRQDIEAMVYGDGASGDPVGRSGSWLTPLFPPGYTFSRVWSTPNELKLKYLADNDFGDLKGE